MSESPQPSLSSGGNVPWEKVHGEDASWRKKLVGEISDAFILPRYVRLFYDTFGHGRDMSFVEVGSGNGENSKAVLAANTAGVIKSYLTTEVFPEGVEWLKNQGLNATQASAEALPFPDEHFDGVVEFDVMHHVDHPRLMAKEMMRVGRGRLLLTESNGLSIPRKLLELTPARKAAGERSYTPWKYRSFFDGHDGFRVTNFVIYPFLFPFKCPSWFLPMLVWFNRAIEFIPIARWQCSSVVIVVDYARENSAPSSESPTS